MNVNDYKEYYFDLAKKIFSTPSPTGYTNEIMPLIKRLAEENGATFTETNNGAAILTYKGKKSEKALGLSAHTDTLGLMVRSVSANGEINFTRIGGIQLATIDGEYCTIITRTGKRYTGTILSTSPSSHVYDDADKKRAENSMYIRLDEVVKSDKDVYALGIDNGDYIAVDPKTTVTESGFLKSRFIDDKASVCDLLTVLKIMKDNDFIPEYDVKILISVYEEVGHGASFVPDNLISMLAVDMGCVGTDLKCDEYKVSVCAKDSNGPYSYDLTTRLINLAKDNGIDYAVDVYPHYGSDVGAMWEAGYDVKGALIGQGVHASHGMERTHFKGIENTIKLILLYLGFEL